jgi:hypothetical protein
MPIVIEKRGAFLVVWLKNETLYPMQRCSLSLNSLQRFSATRRDFHRHPFTPIALLDPKTINGGELSKEAAALVRNEDVDNRVLVVSNSHFKLETAGTFLAELLVESDGRQRKELLFFKGTPGGEPEFIRTPRTHDTQCAYSGFFNFGNPRCWTTPLQGR